MQLALQTRDHCAHHLSFNLSMNIGIEVGIKTVRDGVSMLNKELRVHDGCANEPAKLWRYLPLPRVCLGPPHLF